MADFKEYRSVSEFPADAEQLTYEELLTCYQELRSTYGSLTKSKGQLFPPHGEANRQMTSLNQQIQKKEQKLTTLSQKIDQTILSLNQKSENLKQRQDELQVVYNSLANNRFKLNVSEEDRKNILDEINQLQAERKAISTIVADLDSTYQAVKNKEGIIGTVYRKHNLMRSIFQILNTDMNELIKQQKRQIEAEKKNEGKLSKLGKTLLNDQSAS